MWYWREKSRTDRVIDGIVGGFWALYASQYLASVIRGGGWTNLGLVIFYTQVAILFVLRRPARRQGSWLQTAVAVADVFLPIVLLRPARMGFWPGNVMQGVALVTMVVAAFSLGPSFGIAPADRGLRREGLYGWVRHPLYAGETLFYLGYLVAHLSWRNLAAVLVAVAFLVVRIRWEESILAGYEEYARQVRWRFVPYVW